MLGCGPKLPDHVHGNFDTGHEVRRSATEISQDSNNADNVSFETAQMLFLPSTSNTELPLPGFETTIASFSFSSVMSGNFFL